MLMAQNASSGVRTQHVDTRYHFVRENLEDGIIKIEFVKSVDNESDIFTKNVTQEIYQKYVEKFWRSTLKRSTLKRSTLKRSTVAERFVIGRVLEISLTFKPNIFSLSGDIR
jgi:sulfatase maturation enzyme AslB (radical SAM superfamily)